MKRAALLLLCAALAPARASVPGAPAEPPQALTLAEAEAIAARTHPRISAADFEAAAAKQRIREARAGFFPQVTADAAAVGAGDGGDTRLAATGGLNNPTVFSRQSDGVTATQLLTDFGRTSALTAGARFAAEAGSADARLARAQVRLAVDRAYFEALRAQRVAAVARETVDARQLFYDQTEALAQGKLKSELDARFAQVNLDEASLLLLRARNGLAQAQAALATALGYRDPREFVLAEEKAPALPPADEASLVAQALQDRPEAAARRDRYEAARRQAAAEKDNQYPTVTAVAGTGVSPVRNDSQLNESYVAAGINIALPVANGGRLSAQAEEARLRAAAAERDLDATENEIVRDVRVARLDAAAAFQAIGVTGRLLANAGEALDLAQARYRSGLGSIVEVSQAQLNQTNAELQNADARYDYQIRLAELSYQLGDFQ